MDISSAPLPHLLPCTQRAVALVRDSVISLSMGNCLISISNEDVFPHAISWSGSSTILSPSPSGRLSSNILPFSTRSNLVSCYSFGLELGRGRYGVIRSCTCRSSGAPFACKTISKLHLCQYGDIKDAVREVCVMKRLSSSPECGVVGLHEVFEDRFFIHLILELCRGGDLYERIVAKQGFSETHAAIIMKAILKTLKYCHSIGIMHRDIKPENILFVDDSDTSPIKLADFGLALEFSAGQKFSNISGSSYYMAPEVLRGKYSAEIDIWSAGVVMYVLLSGAPPFWGPTEKHIYKAIRKGQLVFPSKPWKNISIDAKDLITKMLNPDAQKRITIAQALEHPWIRLQSK